MIETIGLNANDTAFELRAHPSCLEKLAKLNFSNRKEIKTSLLWLDLRWLEYPSYI